jgi:hypothetical protein
MTHAHLVSDIALLAEDRVLLIRYSRPGYDIMLKDFEHPEEAAKHSRGSQPSGNVDRVR